MKIDKKQSREKFLTVFPQIVKETTDVLKSYGMPQDAIEWYTKNLNYNTPSGKLNRGLSVVDTYGILKGYETYDDFSEDEYKLSAILGWCIELLQAYFLVADDIMDKSVTRRGHTCWYRVEEVQEIAVNDAFMLEGAIYILLKKYFSKKPYYVKVMELFHDVTFKTECGQLLDLITAPEDKVDLAKFSLNKQMFIITYKTAFYSFYLPVALAMHMAGVDDESDLKQASDVLIPLGQYFQIQDDYLDCFGKPEDIGKIGTDIQDNKCSWVVNTALEICNAEQRKLLDENYGRKDPVKEKKCKDLFIALKIDDRFHQYEEGIVSKIRKNISNIDETRGFKKQTLTAFLDKIYKRKK